MGLIYKIKKHYKCNLIYKNFLYCKIVKVYSKKAGCTYSVLFFSILRNDIANLEKYRLKIIKKMKTGYFATYATFQFLDLILN